MNSRFLWLFAAAVLVQGCREGPTNMRLMNDYSLSSYEWNPENRYFIEQSGKVIIPPLVKSVETHGNIIYGYFDWSGDPAFEPMPSGYFLIDAVSNEVRSGLLWSDIASAVPAAKKSQLKDPSEFR